MRFLSSAIVLLLAASAHAYSYDTFLGWSPDLSFYAYASAGTDGEDHPNLCYSDAKRGSTSWPKRVPRPSDDSPCVQLCDEDGFKCTSLDRVKKWVREPSESGKGPRGETISVKQRKDTVTVAVFLDGREIAKATQELERKQPLRSSWWRPDGQAVAVMLGVPDPDEPADGWPPPRYLIMVPLRGAAPAAPVASRTDSSASAANAKGMKLYRDEEYAGALTEFRRALTADPTLVVARYNLACVLALTNDKKGALAELKTLAASSDPAAKVKLAKARRDPDLVPLLGDGELRALVGAPSEADRTACNESCEDTQSRCESRCAKDNRERACFILCTSHSESCQQRCASK